MSFDVIKYSAVTGNFKALCPGIIMITCSVLLMLYAPRMLVLLGGAVPPMPTPLLVLKPDT